MRIYIAGQYARRDEFREYAKDLLKRGHFVTSRWLQETLPLDGIIADSTHAAATANVDLIDIDDADAVVFFSEDPLIGVPRGGRHVEFGYALKAGKWIDVIGPMENVFHYGQPMVKHYDTFEQYLDANTVEVTF